MTGSIKNHFGSIDNPREFHPNNATNPGIPEINVIPVIRDKQKLIIADALLCVFDGGPRWNRDKICVNNEIIIGTDPVGSVGMQQHSQGIVVGETVICGV